MRRPGETVARFVPLALGSAVVLAAALAPAQEGLKPQVAGASVYKTYCAVCHGPSGQGDGPLADSLRFKPPDLTALARKNAGKFPKDQVLRIVDGRKPVKGHGGPEMPVWGDAFRNAEGGYSEEQVKERIAAVVDHLESLQAR